MHNKNASSNSTYRKWELKVYIQTAMVLRIVINCNIVFKCCHLQLFHTKVVICNCFIQKLPFGIVEYKSCHLQLLHTKVIICYCWIQKLSFAVVAYCTLARLPTIHGFCDFYTMVSHIYTPPVELVGLAVKLKRNYMEVVLILTTRQDIVTYGSTASDLFQSVLFSSTIAGVCFELVWQSLSVSGHSISCLCMSLLMISQC